MRTPPASRPTRCSARACARALARARAGASSRYEDFAQAEVERLEELRLVAIEERIDAELALGRHDTLVAELEALIVRNIPCASGFAGS